ncbi:phenylacetate-CoA oxygenase subunit PaaC [Paracrocinitomix mangrovi]|uniref:1,2-phenylacetyl-CoA epoxidase subunit PaaC n=1 Tax=Paracrocinitomix mangrovi TaxID=2862509 RepID=UPI001C8E1FA2|nr:1,2-phenylacetyl-CoA epoxidase subunit PaaC [Paracrocinitomix mangrovi]UKN03112.1 phenylacetate-CoA oxygenase subunit PaaC [Paracrocinitomix mangrovi]
MMNITIDNDFAKFVIRLADTEMILGQRLSEMCSNGPFLEEDIALSNSALDLIGRAEELYKIVSEVEAKGVSPDDYVFRRNEREYFCIKLVEQPNEDFAWTIARSYLHDVYAKEVFTQLTSSENEQLSALAKKVLVEIEYNLDRSRDWMVRLGQGTEESNKRLQVAVDHMYKYISELWDWDEIDNKYLSNADQIKANWETEVKGVLNSSNINIPELSPVFMGDYRNGVHSEFLGHLLTEMQYLPRAYPNAKW